MSLGASGFWDGVRRSESCSIHTLLPVHIRTSRDSFYCPFRCAIFALTVVFSEWRAGVNRRSRWSPSWRRGIRRSAVLGMQEKAH